MLIRKSTLLAFAFAGLLLIIGGSAFAIWQRAAGAQREAASLHGAHLQAGDALSSIRANVFLASILTRDYLLDPDSSHAQRYAEQLNAIRAATERSFQTLGASNQSVDGKQTVHLLQVEVDNFWDPTKIVLNWTPEQKNQHRVEFLQDRVRHREEIMDLAAHLEQLIATNFAAERSRITSADRSFQESLIWTTTIAMLLAFGIAAATVARMINLESQSAQAEIELRQLSGQIRNAQEQERRYLSRELHDQAGQMLTGLRMELASISYQAGEAEFSERLTHAKSIVEQTVRVIRSIAMLLRPSMLDDLGLTAALNGLVREVSRSSGMEMHAKIDPEIDCLPDTHATCTYRLVQEALTNCVRHSGARRIDLNLTAWDDGVNGAIIDDGRGFDVAAIRQTKTGLGLAGMEERVRELGGSLRIVSSAGHGTITEFRLPRPESQPAAQVDDTAHVGSTL